MRQHSPEVAEMVGEEGLKDKISGIGKRKKISAKRDRNNE